MTSWWYSKDSSCTELWYNYLLATISAESDSITVGNNRLIATFAGRLAMCFVSGIWLDTVLGVVAVYIKTHWGRDKMAAVSQTTRIFLNENIIISIKISLKFVPKGLINNIPALVLIMAWRRPGDKPLSEPMMVSLSTHICVTRPQWVNKMAVMFLMQIHLIIRQH